MENKTDILIYRMEDGNVKVDVRLEDETVWMTQKSIAKLYQKKVNTINEHINNIYDEGELEEKSTIRNNRIIRKECIRRVYREINLYDLDMILVIAIVFLNTEMISDGGSLKD